MALPSDLALTYEAVYQTTTEGLRQSIVVGIGSNTFGHHCDASSSYELVQEHTHTPNKIGIMSRFGTLTYEAVHQTIEEGLGQSNTLGTEGGSFSISYQVV